MNRCNLCLGTGVRYCYSVTKRWGQVIRAHNCHRCNGRGEVLEGQRNPERPRREPKPVTAREERGREGALRALEVLAAVHDG